MKTMLEAATMNSPRQLAKTGAWWRWGTVLLSGLLIWALPVAGLARNQRSLLAFFVATVVALVVQPVPMAVAVLTAMTGLALTETLPPASVLAGFSNPTVWLILTAFLFSRAVTDTRVGARIAFFFISRFGRSLPLLAYSIAASDLVLAPFVPSDTARGGGIVFPITRSVAEALEPESGEARREIGGYLVLVAFHTTYIGSAMFLTGMAANPLIAEFAHRIGHVELTWLKWMLAAAVPGGLSLLLLPYLIYKLYRPRERDTHVARLHAREELARMGRMSRREWTLVVIMLAVMTGWVTSPWHSIPNAFVALGGVCAILISRVMVWEELLAERKAWDALVWFAPLIMMADELYKRGIITALSKSLFGYTAALPWGVALIALVLIYLYIHYGFASMTAQVTALYPPFLTAALAARVPPLLAAFALAFFSNLNAGITHYGTGSAPVYFGSGWVTQGTWWRLGFLLSLVNVVCWLGVGLAWWKAIGIW